MKVLMLDVDGVVVRGRPDDGRPVFADLEQDLGLSAETLQTAFFKRHWQDIVIGRTPLVERLSPVLREIAPHLSAEALIDYWFRDDARLDVDVLSALPRLRQCGMAVFLATNQEHLRAAYLMNELGLAAHVDGMVYSAALGHRKPSPEFYRLAGERAGAEPSDIVLVDDTPDNVDAARAFGWRAVHWTGEVGLEDALASIGLAQA